jgi:hypothetical protein
MTHDLNRRRFAKLLSLGAAAVLAGPVRAQARSSAASRLWQDATAARDEQFWQSVRAQFLMPPGFAVLNAANLCPSPTRVIDVAIESTRSVERDPSPQNRQRTREGREEARRRIAEALHVTPEEIVITRNTSEANNFVSSGVDFKSGDAVVIFSGTTWTPLLAP